MIANAISFRHPMQKIYTRLPPAVEDLDDILALIFTGPCAPTNADFQRTPLLVRRNKVAHALEWLKMNHSDYSDLQIDYGELRRYPETGPPVVVDYRRSDTNREPESTSVHETDIDNGTAEGPCPFIVHGITGQDYSNLPLRTLKALALQHLKDGGKVLAIGHSANPESLFNNPQLYPQMFPWLFPYGHGGIGSPDHKGKLSNARHKKRLLMYHDKRFQLDEHFPIIAFNHEQIKDSATDCLQRHH
ncbi:hypothetical protein BV22DRAFT_1108516 [Leucogyrophana mollusca]|uniref:Uncharacterized protein n=1 Tax=Leucogyrophana mollusca TaxID=85980 RepID=A0ACB8AWG3_9AGAM|nr:hypothetical protein BV22DRAFT_1108516 [Leucogyrophana mollusca]